MELKHIHAKPNLLPGQPTQAKTAVKCIQLPLSAFTLLNYACLHAQHFALLNLILKLQFCGETSLEFPFFNFPGRHEGRHLIRHKGGVDSEVDIEGGTLGRH